MIEVFFSETGKYNRDTWKINSNKNTIFIGPHLDIGDISGNASEPKRYQSLNRILNNKELSQNELEKLSNSQNSEITKLIDAAKKRKVIRIWKSNTPFSTCGFAFVCNQLESIQCEISVVPLDSFQIKQENNFISYTHWGEVDPTEYHYFLAKKIKLSETDKRYQAKLWRNLKAENSLLRAVVNGKLISVPENFYDPLLLKILLKNFSNKEFVVSKLIASVLGEYPNGVSDGWYLYRINQLIEENKLIVTSSEKHAVSPYQRTMKIKKGSLS